ncbi:DJ-1/PfpI family protein [Parvularcula sp. LCG005]|uniref:DJ-1/PfpI family protein n=1 Tax=Parvularcula sp. LCG005 TaxID=3078805 RepID=UPI002943710B|nr:DJ-1/PfpI family protein [Parvularcula sp. LCG005]WOI52566.1 DJ-1/PfpI family protein [Parvularcula sp. LCG005]
MHIVFLVFPNVTQLDMTGPAQVLSRLPGASVSYVAKTHDPVPTDSGFSILPTATFDAIQQADVLCIPGGFGIVDVMADPESLSFVRRIAAGANYITSVCTGALVLGAAGCLEGRRATTHWAYHDLLADAGAIPTQGRYVQHGKLMTGGGVTAGIDFGLALARLIVGEPLVQSIANALEYDPEPPVRFNREQAASDPVMQRRFEKPVADTRDALKAALR